MANFDGLIRGAISSKNARTASERKTIYDSSRKALQKIISQNRSLTVEAATTQINQLEAVISGIEAEFSNQEGQPAAEPIVNQAPENQPVAPPAPEQPPVQQATPEPVSEPPAPPLIVEEAIDQPPPSTQIQDVPPPAPAPSAPPSEPVEPVPPPVPPAPSPTPAALEPEPQAPAVDSSDPMAELEEILSGGKQPTRPVRTPEELEVEAPQPVRDEPTIVPPAAEISNHQSDAEYVSVDVDTDGMHASADDIGEQELPPEFTQRRKSQRRFVWILAVFACLGVLAWVGYIIFSDLVTQYLGEHSNQSVVISQNTSKKDSDSVYITILEPGDLTALSVTDNGQVEIVNEQSNEMIRLRSVRNSNNLDRSASPITVRLKPGVIEQIRGKRVTVEIFARSGGGGSSQFTVECKFEDTIGCGRKRFRVGTQPEASIFAFTMIEDFSTQGSAQIAINTDITETAAITGDGDVLDIVYVRLRTMKDK